MKKQLERVVVLLVLLLCSALAFAQMPGADAANDVKDSLLNDWGPPVAIIAILIVAIRKKFMGAGWGEVAVVFLAIGLFFGGPSFVDWIRGVMGS